MQKSLVLFAIVFAYLNLFSEGNPKDPHTCLEYAKVRYYIFFVFVKVRIF